MGGFQLRPREQRQVQGLAERSREVSVAQRAQALLGLHEGRSVAEVAGFLRVSRQTVYNWAQAFRGRTGLEVSRRLREAPRGGRPATALGIIDPLIEAVITDDPRDYGYPATVWTAPLLRRYLDEVHALSTSRKSVSRALRRLGLHWKRPRHCLARRSPTWRQAKGG